MYMVLFVLDDPDHLDQILGAWASKGVTGTTIIESTGLHRRLRKHIPMRYLYGDSDLGERGNTTLLVIVKDEAMTQMCLEEVEKIVGDLDGPNTGVFASWPLGLVKGVPSR